MAGSSVGVAVRYPGPAVGGQQSRPAAIELAMVALADAVVAGPGVEAFVKALVPHAHLRVDRHASCHDAAAGLGAFLPIVHVVLLERAGGAEAAHAGMPDRLLDLRRCRLVDKDPGPHLGLVRPARLPDAEGARGRAQQREVWEHRADDRVDPPCTV